MAFALLVVAETAAIIESIGLSATLGAFSAGALLADWDPSRPRSPPPSLAELRR
jgi:Kef-type K+ transport system membrane component KefB